MTRFVLRSGSEQSQAMESRRFALRSQRHGGMLLIGVLLVMVGAVAQAQGGRARSKADAWIGKDASALLMQLRVDGGSVQIDEIDATNETSYTWTTSNAAWTEEINDVHTAPIGPGLMQQTVSTTEVHHAATHRCTLTFFADADGIVRRWAAEGSRCGTDVLAPKR